MFLIVVDSGFIGCFCKDIKSSRGHSKLGREANELRISRAILVFTCLTVLLAGAAPALCWSNGGFSANPTDPDYGTHDWIAQHALDYLPAQEKQYITDNLMLYLLGTELPDNSNKTIGGIGDTTKHHVYYNSAGVLVDAASAIRANDTYNQALIYLKSGDYADAAKSAGTLTHYIADIAVFGHVMGAATDWGAEVHHSDYEDHVDNTMHSYQSNFNSYLSYDGMLAYVSAYDATVTLANNTVFGGSSQKGSVWMDTHYNWSDSAFSGRCGESLNLAVNAVADVLHTLYIQLYPSLTVSPTPAPSPPTPTASPIPIPSVTPTPSPTVSPTPTANPTPTPTLTATPAPTASPTPKPSSTPTATTMPTTAPTTTPKPSTSPQPTPTVPEFPAATLLLAAALALTVALLLCKRKQKQLRFDVC